MRRSVLLPNGRNVANGLTRAAIRIGRLTIRAGAAALSQCRDRLRHPCRRQSDDVRCRAWTVLFADLDRVECRGFEELEWHERCPRIVGAAGLDRVQLDEGSGAEQRGFAIASCNGDRCFLLFLTQPDVAKISVPGALQASKRGCLACAGDLDEACPQFLAAICRGLNEELHRPRLRSRRFDQIPACLLRFTGVDAESHDFVAREILNGLGWYLGAQIEQSDIDLHLLNVAPKPSVELR